MLLVAYFLRLAWQVATANMALKVALPQLTEGEKGDASELLMQYVSKLRNLMMDLEEKCHVARKCVTYKRYVGSWAPDTFEKHLEERACLHVQLRNHVQRLQAGVCIIPYSSWDPRGCGQSYFRVQCCMFSGVHCLHACMSL